MVPEPPRSVQLSGLIEFLIRLISSPSMVLLGVGAGIAFPSLMAVAMSGATPQDAGLASGLVNTTAQVGGALGLAVLATLSASHTKALSHPGVSHAAALVSGEESRRPGRWRGRLRGGTRW